MRFFFDKTANMTQMTNLLKQADSDQNTKSILILSCAENEIDPHLIDPVLQSLSKPVFGGIFPEIIYEKAHYTTGTLIIGFPFTANVHTIENLDSNDIDFFNILSDNFSEKRFNQTAMILIDATSRHISSFVDAVFMNFGIEMNYIGGGTGDLNLSGKPNIFTKKGMLKQAAQFIDLPIKTGIGVHHGWKPLCGPYEITESDDNLIISINNQNPFDLYREAIKNYTGTIITRENFSHLSQSFPLGINKPESEKVIRDLMKIEEDGSLLSVGEVPENCFVDIMTGDPEALIETAHKTLNKAESEFGKGNRSAVMLLDCISRALFMEEEFNRELMAVSIVGLPLFGALTLGEIANNKNDYLEFYNKTSVVGIFSE